MGHGHIPVAIATDGVDSGIGKARRPGSGGARGRRDTFDFSGLEVAAPGDDINGNANVGEGLGNASGTAGQSTDIGGKSLREKKKMSQGALSRRVC